MTTHHLELSDEVYRKLQKAAETERVSSEEWIDARLPRTPTDERPLSKVLKGLVGVADSRTDLPHNPRRSTVCDLIAEKFAKQGILTPHGNPSSGFYSVDKKEVAV